MSLPWQRWLARHEGDWPLDVEAEGAERPGGVPAQEPSPGALGWAKARRALNTGRIQQMLREEGDTPMRPKREKAPSMRREVRRIAKAAQEQQHQHQHRERRESGGGRRDSNGGDETSFVI